MLDVTSVLDVPTGVQLPDAPVAIPIGNITVDGNTFSIVLPPDPNTYGFPVNSRGIRYSTDGVNWTGQFLVTSPVAVPAPEAAALAFDTEYFIQWRVASLIPGETSTAGPWSPSVAVTTGSAPAPDTVAPILSAASAAANGATAWAGTVTTDEDNGTLFYLVDQNSSQTAGPVQAGPSITITSAGEKSLSGGGLTAETGYYLHVVHVDAAGNVSNVVSSALFTTPAQGASSGTVTISQITTMDDVVAPYYAQFVANVTGASVAEPGNDTDHDPTNNELTYIWTFGDPASSAGSDKVVNLPAAWNDHNVAYGKRPAHVYMQPGTYTIIVTVYEQDGTFVGADDFDITVGDADALYTGSRTILVNAAGAGDANYPGAQVETDVEDAINTLNALSQTGQILLNRGETFDWSSRLSVNSAWPNFRLGDYGTGALPIIQLNSSNSLNSTPQSQPQEMLYFPSSFNKDALVYNIDWRGLWDSVGLTGTGYRCIQFDTGSGVRQILVSGCKFNGFWTSIEARSGGTVGCKLCIHNTDITNWKNYGLFLGSHVGWISIIGSAVHQSEFANANGDGKNQTDNDHGPLRFTGSSFMFFSGNDFFSNNGWTSNSAGGGAPAFASSQPCLRWLTTALANQRCKGIIERNVLEGGYYALSMNHQKAELHRGNQSTIIDKLLVIGTADTWYAVGCDYAGTTLRNVFTIVPNVPGVNIGYRNMFDHVYSVSSFALDKASPVQVYNCTQIVLIDDTNAGSGQVYDIAETGFGGSFNDFTMENNANYTPNRTGGAGEAADLSSDLLVTVGGTLTSRYVGRRDFPNDPLGQPNTAFASPAGFVTSPRPNPSSPLVGDATSGLTAYDNFEGTVRTGTPNRGAV